MPTDSSSACLAKPIFERSRNETTNISIRKGASRRVVREIARSKATSGAPEPTAETFNAGLILRRVMRPRSLRPPQVFARERYLTEKLQSIDFARSEAG